MPRGADPLDGPPRIIHTEPFHYAWDIHPKGFEPYRMDEKLTWMAHPLGEARLPSPA